MLPATVTIGVFGLFHPQALEVEPWGPSRVELHCAPQRTLEGAAHARITSDCIVTGPNNAPTDFVLSVPGRIQRHFLGTLKVTKLLTGELIAAVTMPLETAVASIIAAESPAGARPAMLEAQAIVTRSYLKVGPRHNGFDFCDTTHCQFLKDPPGLQGPAARAARETAGRLLVYRDNVIQAFYAARCNGKLAPLPEVHSANEYPYFAVSCDYCHKHPATAPERSNARPHHHGMCQLGANSLAQQGWTAARILAHYYPGAEIR